MATIPKHSEISPQGILQLCNDTTRRITAAVWHCSATREGENFDTHDIEQWHRNRGFSEIGYNAVVLLDGTIVKGRNWNRIPAHVAGENSHTLGFCYIGGLDKNGSPKDTRNINQLKSMVTLTAYVHEKWKEKGTVLDWMGHRDYSPDLNGDGIIEPFEFMKACPCFDVKSWAKEFGI